MSSAQGPSPIRQQLQQASQAPQPGGGQQPATGAQPGQGGFPELLAAFQRCEQTKQCSPQDRAILQAGLPKLVQMAQMIQQILAATAGGGQQQPGGGATPQPGAQPPQPGQ